MLAVLFSGSRQNKREARVNNITAQVSQLKTIVIYLKRIGFAPYFFFTVKKKRNRVLRIVGQEMQNQQLQQNLPCGTSQQFI